MPGVQFVMLNKVKHPAFEAYLHIKILRSSQIDLASNWDKRKIVFQR
jgi:hypothetical protein